MNNVQALLSQVNVLIIDDSPSNVNALVTILKQKKYNVKIAMSSELALYLVKENPIDIILVNVNLSDMDGYCVCEIIKTDEKLKEIPIIFTCTSSNNIDKDKAFNYDGVDYITMPFNYNEVLARIETQLKLRFMQLQLNKLDNKMIEHKQELEDITTELKEFNIMLDEEITERTKTEEALRESERQFRNAIEEAPVPIMLFCDDGEIIKINRTWTEIVGYTIKDIPTTMEWSDVSDVFLKSIRIINLKKRQHDGEYTVITKNHEIRTWDFYSAYIGKMQDGRKMFMRIAIDLTERKYMEKLHKKMEEERRTYEEAKKYDKIRTEFFTNISHELRTPINVIFSALQMQEVKLTNNSLINMPADIYKYTKVMKQNCYRILRLVNNLIDITKIDSGYLFINKVNCNIVELIEEITLSVTDYAKNKGLSIIFDTDVEEKVIACDPEKIERIVLNLLSNSIKFTPFDGKIMVNIEDGIESVCIRVKDTGRGIPSDKLNTICERFVQVDKSLTRDNEGSGIGLSLVKGLVELHGGEISIESKEGCGTEFMISLPCDIVEYEENNEVIICDTRNKNLIEKINLEFSDIYN